MPFFLQLLFIGSATLNNKHATLAKILDEHNSLKFTEHEGKDDAYRSLIYYCRYTCSISLGICIEPSVLFIQVLLTFAIFVELKIFLYSKGKETSLKPGMESLDFMSRNWFSA